MITLYNTLTRRKETFEPIEPGKVKCMFVVRPFTIIYTSEMQDLLLTMMLLEDILNTKL